MLGHVWSKTLYDMRFHVTGWSIGFGLLALMTIGLYPEIAGSAEYDQLWEDMPESLKALFGDVESITSLSGYMRSQLLAYIAVLLAILTINQGAHAIAGEERDNTIDLLLAQPIGRRRVVVEKAFAILLATLAIVLVIGVILVLGALLVGVDVAPWRLFVAPLLTLPTLWAFTALALLGSCTTTKGRAVLIATIALLGSYFLGAFAALVQALEPLRVLSMFYHQDQNDVLAGTYDIVSFLVPLVVALALFAAALWRVQHKELRG